DDFPHRLLSSAQGYLANRLERRAARALVGQGNTHSDNVSYQGWKAKDRDMQRVSLICFAAAAALSFAIGDDKPSRFEVGSSLTPIRGTRVTLSPCSWRGGTRARRARPSSSVGLSGGGTFTRRSRWRGARRMTQWMRLREKLDALAGKRRGGRRVRRCDDGVT